MNSEALLSVAPAENQRRHFLLLQMPCGRFGRDLYRAIIAAGHRCTRVAINGGDMVNGLRGNTMPYHRAAIQALKPRGITIHVLEEGYLRPNWITCERDGVNGHSALTGIDLDRIPPQPTLPAEHIVQGSNWNYCWAGIVYYFWTFLLTPLFPRYQTHRDLDIVGEATLWL